MTIEPTLPCLTNKFLWLTIPEEVLTYHLKEGTNDWEVLVKWKGLLEHEATWEINEELHNQFPVFPLEDKADLHPQAFVKPPIRIKRMLEGVEMRIPPLVLCWLLLLLNYLLYFAVRGI